jgi:hypothetical protein
MSFYFFVKALNRKNCMLANTFAYIVSLNSMVQSHPVASIALIVIVISFVFLNKNVKSKSFLWIYSLTALLVFFIQTYNHTGFLLEDFVKSLSPTITPESIDIYRYHTAQIDPNKFFLRLTYLYRHN